MKVQSFLFSRFDRVTINNIEYQPIDQSGESVSLMRLDGTGTIERIEHAKLTVLRQEKDWRYDRNWFLPAGSREEFARPTGSSLSAMPEDKQDYLAWLHNLLTVVRELRMNREIALSNSSIETNIGLIASRVNEREIARQQIGKTLRAGKKLRIRQLPSPRTILKYYRKFALAGFTIDPMLPRARAPRTPTHVDHEAEELLREGILLFASPQRPTKTEVFSQIDAQFRLENSRRASRGLNELRTFSRRTVDRRIDRLDPFFVACHRLGPDKARALFSTSGAGLPKLFPMARIEMDEWKADVRTWFGKLGITERLPIEIRDKLPQGANGRRWICAAIDVATRCIVGIRIASEPSSTEAVRLLRMVVQDKTEFAKAVGAQSAWEYHGGLGEVAADGGSAFQSTDFHTAVTDLQGNLHFPPVGIPELRATIERFFGTASTKLMPILSGRTFRSHEERGDYDSAGKTVLDDEDLLRILIKWIVDDYHHAPHGGLGGQSPAKRWKQLASDRFVVEPPDRHTRRAALGIELERTLSKQGILVATNHYSSPELREKFRHSRLRKFRVRVDPDDIGALSVLIDGRWYDAPAVMGDLDGITMDAWKHQFSLINIQNRKDAALTYGMRCEAIASIRATNAQRLAQLLPGSVATTAELIDALDRTDFFGKAWQPADSTSFGEESGPFGTLITAKNTEPLPPSTKRTVPRDPIPDNKANWRLEDE